MDRHEGKLTITNLGNVGSKEEAEMADWKSKKCITDLILKWNVGSDDNSSTSHSNHLEAIEPNPSKLEGLTLENYNGDELPKWIFECFSVNELNIDGCINLKRILMGKFGLRKLKVEGCEILESFVVPPCIEQLELISLHFLTSLKDVEFSGLLFLRELKITQCENLKSLARKMDELPPLESIVLNGCPLLESLFDGIGVPTTVVKLTIINCPLIKLTPPVMYSL